MNRVENIRIQLPARYAKHREQITDTVREGIMSRRWCGEAHIEKLNLGSIMTTQHSTPHDIANEILARIDLQMEYYR